jgi:hypothetical protein
MELAPMDQFKPKPITRPTGKQRVMNERYERLESKLVHAAEMLADKIAGQFDAPADEPMPVEVRRRAIANALQTWRKCPRRTCSQAQACRGQPAHCLDACMPALPPGALAGYIASSRRRRRN